jgi:hypothetical protein
MVDNKASPIAKYIYKPEGRLAVARWQILVLKARFYNRAYCRGCRMIFQEAGRMKSEHRQGSNMIYRTSELPDDPSRKNCPMCFLFWGTFAFEERKGLREFKTRYPQYFSSMTARHSKETHWLIRYDVNLWEMVRFDPLTIDCKFYSWAGNPVVYGLSLVDSKGRISFKFIERSLHLRQSSALFPTHHC